MTYDAKLRLRTATATDGDPNGQAAIQGTWNPNDDATQIEYDPVSGLPLKVTDALGQSTTYTYNTQGQVTSVTDPANNTTTYTYDTNGIDLLSITDADNNVIATFTYGSNHEVLTATDAYNNTTTYTYTSWGDVATSTDPNGIVTTNTYDTSTRLLENTTVDGLTTASYTYDTSRRVHTATDADGITLTYAYDDADRVNKITYPDSTFEQFEYIDCCGVDMNQLVRYIDRDGRETSFTYDANGNRTSATDPKLNTVYFEYNANNQLTKLTDANNHETTWQFDDLNRPIRKDYADGNFEQYFYDAVGQLIKQRQASGTVIGYEYDSRGNLNRIDYPNMPYVSFTYDDLSRVTSMTDALGTTDYSYDLMSRVTSTGGLWANDAVSYDYDNLGRRSELGLNGRSVAFGYDNLSRLNEVQRSTDTFAYTYKSNGSQLDHIELPNGTKSTFDYDTLGRLTQIQDLNSSSANISKFNYGYDNRDVKTYMERALGTATTQHVDYSYDDIDELVSEVSNEVTPLVNNSYDYDAAQNRTASTVNAVNSSFTINNVNQISAYTLSGSPVTVTHDDNGNTTKLGPKDLTWDDANRLTSVTVPSVSKSEYQYDGLDRRRIAKTYSWNSGTNDWDLQSERRFIYDGMDLIEERDGSNNLIAFYTRDGNIGGVLSRTTSSATFYYHYDGNGNVVSLTDANENVVATYEYDAYGNLQASSGTEANNNPFRFSTKYFDAVAGLYDYGFRFYDPVTGRWLNRDPIGEDGGINLYAFVGNSPGNAVDEYGMDALYLVGRNKRDPSFFRGHALHYAQQYKKQTGKKATIVEVRSISDINAALKSTPNIDHLEYVGHGGPGQLYLSENSLTATNVRQLYTGNVQKDADIAITACQSAVSENHSGSMALAFAKRFKVPVIGYKSGVSFGPPIDEQILMNIPGALSNHASPHYVRPGTFLHRGSGRMTVSPNGGMRTGHPGINLYGESYSGR